MLGPLVSAQQQVGLLAFKGEQLAQLLLPEKPAPRCSPGQDVFPPSVYAHSNSTEVASGATHRSEVTCLEQQAKSRGNPGDRALKTSQPVPKKPARLCLHSPPKSVQRIYKASD